MQEFTFPGSIPSKKNTQRIGRHGGIYKIEKVRQYEQDIAAELMVQKAKPIEGKMIVYLEIVYDRDKDLDNSEGTLYDALQYGGLYKNDIDIVEKHVKKRKCKSGEKPYAQVIIGVAKDEI